MTVVLAHTVACASPVSYPEKGLGAPGAGGASSSQAESRARGGRVLVRRDFTFSSSSLRELGSDNLPLVIQE